MTAVLVATGSGCRVFSAAGEGEIELPGRSVSALASAPDGACLAVVEEREIWRRSADGDWSKIADTEISLQALVSVGDTIFAGSMADEAVMLRVSASGRVERLTAFDHVEGRGEWFAGGPPLGVRGLTATADGVALLAAVHVGGIPRSLDGGESWVQTIPVMFDVHEVRAHRSLPNVVAAAAAVGLCVSDDGGLSWRVLTEGLEITNSLAVAVLEDEVLFSVQDGPFAARSQVWRWPIGGGERLEQVHDGLPEWLDGKVDTDHIAAGDGRSAIVDGGGHLWLSTAGASRWVRIASELGYVSGVLIV